MQIGIKENAGTIGEKEKKKKKNLVSPSNPHLT